jgi:hypothetical protein
MNTSIVDGVVASDQLREAAVESNWMIKLAGSSSKIQAGTEVSVTQ